MNLFIKTVTKFISLFLIWVVPIFAQAQTAKHVMMWTRFAVDLPINEKIKLESEFQWRTQNNFFGNNSPIENNLLKSFRSWGFYKVNKQVQMGVSPFAYFLHQPLIAVPSDVNKASVQEYRFSVALDFQTPIHERFSFVNRACLEYRNFVEKDNSLRFRNRIGLKTKVSDKLSILLFEELFINTFIGDVPYQFDQDRWGLLASYLINQHWKVELGFIHLRKAVGVVPQIGSEENGLLHLYYAI